MVAIARRVAVGRACPHQDGLSEADVIEVVTASAIHKTPRSRCPARRRTREKLYVIINTNLGGTLIYTKGALRSVGGADTDYITKGKETCKCVP